MKYLLKKELIVLVVGSIGLSLGFYSLGGGIAQFAFFAGVILMGIWVLWVFGVYSMLNSTSHSPTTDEKTEAYDVVRKKILATWINNYFPHYQMSVETALKDSGMGSLFTVSDVSNALTLLGYSYCKECEMWYGRKEYDPAESMCMFCIQEEA